MENAHLRTGMLEYDRQTEKLASRVRVRVSHYIGAEEQAHLVSVFGNDSDVGAITAAVHEQSRFRLTFLDGRTREISFGEGALCHRGSLKIPGRKHAVRHMIALSEELRGMTSLAKTFFLRADPHEIWTALVHRLGLPAVPEWAEDMVRILEDQNRITSLDGIGCAPILVSASAEEILDWMESGVATGTLRFPEKNGPIQWSNKPLAKVLEPISHAAEEENNLEAT
jgi:hypothetical protein